MRKRVNVFVRCEGVPEVDWSTPTISIEGESVSFKGDPHTRVFIVEDSQKKKIWFFPMENVECLSIEDVKQDEEKLVQ